MRESREFISAPARGKIQHCLPDFHAGAVWLAGAGPGDAGLMTLLAAHAAAEADCIFYDALVDDSCLALAKPQAELRCVGKRGGQASIKQAEINAMLIEAARAGKKTLRLKGGDPFVFGRGGEEALALAQAGIPFRIIPGVSAAPAAAAYAGIPLSMRGSSQSFAFVTGHDETGQLPRNINWAALAQGADVLVFYMAARNIEALAAALLAAGRQAAEPMAFVMHAGLARQRLIITELGQAAAAAQAEKLAAPAILILGEAVALHKTLGWFAAEQAARKAGDKG